MSQLTRTHQLRYWWRDLVCHLDRCQSSVKGRRKISWIGSFCPWRFWKISLYWIVMSIVLFSLMLFMIMVMTLAQKLLRNLFQSARSFTWELVEKLFLYCRPTIHCNGVSQLDEVFLLVPKKVLRMAKSLPKRWKWSYLTVVCVSTFLSLGIKIVKY